MFMPNKKEYKSLDSYADIWSVRETKLEGDEFLIRVCVGLKEAIGHPDYPYQVGIAVPLNWKTESGIVSKLESAPLNEIEMEIEKKILTKGTRFVAVLTGRNMREFIFYTSEPKVVEENIRQLKIKIKSHELQSVVQDDPEWNTYKFILG